MFTPPPPPTPHHENRGRERKRERGEIGERDKKREYCNNHIVA